MDQFRKHKKIRRIGASTIGLAGLLTASVALGAGGSDLGTNVRITGERFEDEGRSLEARARISGLDQYDGVRLLIEAEARVRVQCLYGGYGWGEGWETDDWNDEWKGDDEDDDWVDSENVDSESWGNGWHGDYYGRYDDYYYRDRYRRGKRRRYHDRGHHYGHRKKRRRRRRRHHRYYDYGKRYYWSHPGEGAMNATLYIDLEGDRYYSQRLVRREHGSFWFRVETENERRDIGTRVRDLCGNARANIRSVRFMDAKVLAVQDGQVVQGLLCTFYPPTQNGWVNRSRVECHDLYGGYRWGR